MPDTSTSAVAVDQPTAPPAPTDARGEMGALEVLPTKRRARRVGSRARRLLLTLAPFALVVALWKAASIAGLFDPLLIPAPDTVAAALWDGLVTSRTLWPDIGATLFRAIVGLVIGCALGLLVGVAMGQSKWIAYLCEPLISFAFPMPKLALLPLFIVLFGIGQFSLIVMVTLGAFFPMVVNTHAGVTSVSRVLLWNSRTLGANRVQQLRTVVLPAALPHIMSGLRIAGGVSFLLVVAAEMISANNGLGYLIIFSQRNYRPDLVIAGILATAALGFVIDRIVSGASRALLAWQDTSAG
jgi:ABC-type nitrate/sulfonate/bicarbonate transport system permease component